MRKRMVVVGLALAVLLMLWPGVVWAGDGFESHHLAGTWEGSIEEMLGVPRPWSGIVWSLESMPATLTSRLAVR